MANIQWGGPPRSEQHTLRDKLVGTLGEWAAAVGNAVASPLRDGVQNFFTWSTDLVETAVLNSFRPMFVWYRDLPGQPQQIQDLLNQILSGPHQGGAISVISFATALIGGVISAFRGGVLANINFELNKQTRPSRLSVEDYVKHLIRTNGIPGDVRDYGARLGLPDDLIDVIVANVYRRPTFDQIAELYNRFPELQGLADRLLAEQYYDPNEAFQLKKLFQRLPAPSDLTRFAIREVFTPILRDPLMQPPPGDDYFIWAAKQGYTQEVAEFYWMAHWRLIGEEKAVDIVRRLGRKGPIAGQAPEDFFKELLRRDDVLSKYWEPLWETRYRVVNRLDIWRLAQSSVFDRDETYELYLDYGYSPELAAKMADAATATRAGANRELTRSDIEDGYKKGLLTEPEATEALVALNYNIEETAYILARARYALAQDRKNQVAASVKKRYTVALIDQDQARAELTAAGSTAQEIENYLELWTIDRLAKDAQPSVAMLEEFYRRRIITGPDLAQELRNLSYADRYVDWILANIEADIAEANAKLAEAELRRQQAAIKHPTKADLLSWYKAKIIDLTTFRNTMANQGYLNADIDKYLAEVGIVVPVPIYETEPGKVQVATQKLLFRQARITTAQLRDSLLALQMPAALADAIVAYEQTALPPTPATP